MLMTEFLDRVNPPGTPTWDATFEEVLSENVDVVTCDLLIADLIADGTFMDPVTWELRNGRHRMTAAMLC